MIATSSNMILPSSVKPALQLVLSEFNRSVWSDLTGLDASVQDVEKRATRRVDAPATNASPGTEHEWAAGQGAQDGYLFLNDGVQWCRLGLFGAAGSTCRLGLNALEDETAAINYALMGLPQRPERIWAVIGYETQYWIYDTAEGSWFKAASSAERDAWFADDETGYKAIRYTAYDISAPIYGWRDI